MGSNVMTLLNKYRPLDQLIKHIVISLTLIMASLGSCVCYILVLNILIKIIYYSTANVILGLPYLLTKARFLNTILTAGTLLSAGLCRYLVSCKSPFTALIHSCFFSSLP